MLTLVEASKLAQNNGETIRSVVIETFARENEILRECPFDDIQGNAYKYNQEGSLPGVAFRGVNESYTESTGIINPQVESLFIAGGDLDVDKFIVKTQGPGARSKHEMMKIKALSQTIGHKIVKGASSTDPREFDGLQVRLTGNQLLAAGSTSGGDALSLLKLDELIDKVDNPTHLIMSKSMRRRLTQAARNTSVGGFITWEKNALGQQIAFYNGLMILLADNNDDLYATLAYDETNPGGGSAVGTSIYCVSFGDGKLKGIQSGSIDATDLGEQDAKPVFRTRVEWYPGLVLEHPRAAARLYGIKDAAVVV